MTDDLWISSVLLGIGVLLVIIAYVKRGLDIGFRGFKASIGRLVSKPKKWLLIIGSFLLLLGVLNLFIPFSTIVYQSKSQNKTAKESNDTNASENIDPSFSDQEIATKNDDINTKNSNKKKKTDKSITKEQNIIIGEKSSSSETNLVSFNEGFIQIGTEISSSTSLFQYDDFETSDRLASLEEFTIGRKIVLTENTVLYEVIPDLKNPESKFSLEDKVSLRKGKTIKITSNLIEVKTTNERKVFFLKIKLI